MSSIRTLFEFINKMNSLYVGPYHRIYSWDEEFCDKFISKAFDNTEKSIDMGMITYQKCDDAGNYILIDGYQRLMTVLLFVQAVVNNTKIKLASKHHPSNFLVACLSDEEIFKLKINNNDKNDIENIVKNNLDDVLIHNRNFISNYKLFVSKLNSNNLPLLEVLNNILKIKITNMVIDDKTLDEEEIYFNMNQTFTQVDLIRNYVYRELKEAKQNHIFKTYWLEIEKNLQSLTEDFIIDYLTIQNNGNIPNNQELLSEFEAFFENISKLKPKEDIVKHIYRYSSYYKKIYNSDIKDTVLKERLLIINSYQAKDTYPYLMEVFEDYDFAHINRNMLLDILDMTIGFVEQRLNNDNGMPSVNFASLSKDINKMLLLRELTPRIVVENVDQIEDEYVDNHRMTINDIIKIKTTC